MRRAIDPWLVSCLRLEDRQYSSEVRISQLDNGAAASRSFRRKISLPLPWCVRYQRPQQGLAFYRWETEAYIRELAEGSSARWYEHLAAPKQSRKFVYLWRRVEEERTPDT